MFAGERPHYKLTDACARDFCYSGSATLWRYRRLLATGRRQGDVCSYG